MLCGSFGKLQSQTEAADPAPRQEAAEEQAALKEAKSLNVVSVSLSVVFIHRLHRGVLLTCTCKPPSPIDSFTKGKSEALTSAIPPFEHRSSNILCMCVYIYIYIYTHIYIFFSKLRSCWYSESSSATKLSSCSCISCPELFMATIFTCNIILHSWQQWRHQHQQPNMHPGVNK